MLLADNDVVPDSSEIFVFIQHHPRSQWRPYPTDSQLLAEAEEFEELFDTRLGPHTRRLAYFYLLQHPDLFLRSVLAGVGRTETIIFRALRPLVAALMRRGMRITPSASERSLQYVREVFAGVDQRLADGRAFLVGDSFSAADLTFAALAAPVLLPRNYGSELPTLAEVPAEFLARVEEFRSTAAGAFALRVYRDHR